MMWCATVLRCGSGCGLKARCGVRVVLDLNLPSPALAFPDPFLALLTRTPFLCFSSRDMHTKALTLLAVLLATAASLAAATPVTKRGYANGITQDQPLPNFVTQAQLDAVPLVCPDGVARGAKKNILFVPGTGEHGDEAYAQGYLPAYKAQGYNGCYSNLPNRTLGDAQLTAEYVVNQIDEVYRRAGNQQILVVTHSQGGLNVQWALNFWPSRRDKVFAFLGLAPDFHGTAEGPLVTALQSALVQGAPPSVFQQSVLIGKPSNFLAALNKRGDTPLVPTTSVYGSLDEIVQPVVPGTRLNNVPQPNSFSHVNLMQACPGSVVDHFATLLNGAAFWLGLDAFQNGIGRVDRAKALAESQGKNFCGAVPNAGFLALPSQVQTIVNAVISVGSANFLANRAPREPDLLPYAANQ